MYLLRLMLVGVWLGLLWVLFYFFDHYIQSSVVKVLCAKHVSKTGVKKTHNVGFSHVGLLFFYSVLYDPKKKTLSICMMHAVKKHILCMMHGFRLPA